jgi:hypothetical protein
MIHWVCGRLFRTAPSKKMLLPLPFRARPVARPYPGTRIEGEGAGNDVFEGRQVPFRTSSPDQNTGSICQLAVPIYGLHRLLEI